MATILGVYKVPQISYGSTGPILSNKQLFPSFFRTVPSDLVEASAIASLLKYFGWTWVGILASDNNYGVVGSELLKEKIIKTDGCVAFIERVSDHPSKERVHSIAELIGKSSANVIVVYSHVGVMVPIFEMVSQLNVRGKVWLGATSFIITPDLFTKETWESLNGTIAFALHVADIPGFKEFVHNLNPAQTPDDIFIELFWEKAFNCKWHGLNTNQVQADGKKNNASLCTGKEDVASLDPVLFDLDNLRYTYNAYLAVHSFAHALHDLIINNSWDAFLEQSGASLVYYLPLKPEPTEKFDNLGKRQTLKQPCRGRWKKKTQKPIREETLRENREKTRKVGQEESDREEKQTPYLKQGPRKPEGRQAQEARTHQRPDGPWMGTPATSLEGRACLLNLPEYFSGRKGRQVVWN
ncbi:hypothetical protein NDU88_004068 [Pleurodeles waltl]|uniref:Receptor ligand binding region domain-containing protein n=1 Tax=Pleurodeles waltl TaxID=8319 RepID=A0AAV7QBU9_PLEWA|nr:hypothetical protein NDU88_004068 [Pleurodeles waltl]